MIGTGIIVEKAISLLAKQFKLDKVLDYVENPNEADKEIKSLRARVQSLEKMAHPQRDFVICNQCKKQIKEL
jgi:nicotinic acid mononucleotide adenylyltransferase